MTSKINTYKRFTSIFLLIFSLFIGFSNNLSASEPQEHEVDATHVEADTHGGHEAHEANGPIDISAIALEHVSDSHSWHFWGEGHDAVAAPLPIILKGNNGIAFFMSSEFHHDNEGKVVVEKNGERFVMFEEKIYFANETANEYGQYVTLTAEEKEVSVSNATPLDFSITKNVAQMFISVFVILWIFISIAKAYKTQGVTSAPKGKQSFFEPLILFVRDDIAKGNIGHGSEKFVPYLLTVFFMILINNVFGMIPIGANLTGNIAFTLVLSVATLIVTNINGNKNYWSHIFLPHAPKAIWPILIPIEVVGILTKPFALMMRLFANMTAGHIIIISLVGLIFVFKTIYIAPVSVAFALFIDVLECLVAFLQAYVFTMLTALFIGSAVADHNEDGAHNSDDKALEAGH
ncbi:MAG: ATP synthase F0 subunit A [Sphingobacteriaceae bacterium]|nr:ATP synthase F0 subunit A [Sphingobacteriaceae bacterium]